MLTKRQHQALVFIDAEIRKTGSCPSYDEIAAHLSISSRSGVHLLITGLENRGFIRRIPSKTRSIEVIRRPWSEDKGSAMAIAELSAASEEVLDLLEESRRPDIRAAASRLAGAVAAVVARDA